MRELKTLFWLLNQFGGVKKKWKTEFVHNGVMFPKPYVPHKIPIKYNGELIQLEAEAEEYATIYARYLDTEYIKNSKFKQNFFSDWKKYLGKDSIIKSFDSCDFSSIRDHLLRLKEDRQNLSKEDKTLLKEQKDEEQSIYKNAIIDGKKQPVGNFNIEPPGIFIGRGCHPKMGKLKKRIYPEDITLNLSSNAPIPPLPEFFEGRKWGNIINDKLVEWIASWKDTITNKTKYVWLSAHSDMKGKNDMAKFDLAKKLKRKIKSIREANEKNLVSEDEKSRQIATALYFIDKLALRVGNEKGEDASDTVGVTSLRVEHITLLDDLNIKLDFLGKDSVRYVNTIKIDPLIYKNIAEFMKNKTGDMQLFDIIIPNDINKYLQSFMDGLTAKVFRTYNASHLFEKELKKLEKKMDEYDSDDKLNFLLDGFNKANAKVAILCNHQKNISKSFTGQIGSIKKQIKDTMKKIKNAKSGSDSSKKLKERLKKLKAKKSLKIETKNISLGTSKINYIDPRITFEFIQKYNIPVEKIFSKTLIEKFRWAMNDVGFNNSDTNESNVTVDDISSELSDENESEN